MSAVYALARRIDDIGDGSCARREARCALDGAWPTRNSSTSIRRSRPRGRGRRRTPLPAPGQLLRRDHRRVRARRPGHPVRVDRRPRCVTAVSSRAPSAGLSLAVSPPRRAPERTTRGLARVALQLTNILRDVVEDRASGASTCQRGRALSAAHPTSSAARGRLRFAARLGRPLRGRPPPRKPAFRKVRCYPSCTTAAFIAPHRNPIPSTVCRWRAGF